MRECTVINEFPQPRWTVRLRYRPVIGGRALRMRCTTSSTCRVRTLRWRRRRRRRRLLCGCSSVHRLLTDGDYAATCCCTWLPSAWHSQSIDIKLVFDFAPNVSHHWWVFAQRAVLSQLRNATDIQQKYGWAAHRVDDHSSFCGGKVYPDIRRGYPPARALKWSDSLSLAKIWPITWKRCKIRGKLVLITEVTYGLSIGTKIGDLEWPLTT